jgi:hypothetical protein
MRALAQDFAANVAESYQTAKHLEDVDWVRVAIWIGLFIALVINCLVCS